MVTRNLDRYRLAVGITLYAINQRGGIHPSIWIADPVSLNNLHRQPKRPILAALIAEQYKHITTGIVRTQRQLLLLIETKLAMAIGILRFCPHSKPPLGHALPFAGLFIRQAQLLGIDSALQAKAGSNNVRSPRLDRPSCYRCGSLQIPGECPQVGQFILGLTVCIQ